MNDPGSSFVKSVAVIIVPLVLLPVMIGQFRDVFKALMGGPDSEPAAAPPAAPPPVSPSATAPAQPAPADAPIDWAVVLIIGAVIALVAVLVVTVWLSVKAVKRRRVRAEERAALRQRQIDRWNVGVAALAEASDGLWAFEQDPMSVYITRPLLADTSEPASAEFYTAYGLATELHSETIPDDDPSIEAFVTAAKQARDAFVRADQNALRQARLGYTAGGRKFTAGEQRKVDQAGKLLNHAFGAGTTPQEAKSAHAKALSLLDDVGVVVPERLVAKLTLSLEQAHRPELTGGTVSSCVAS